MKNNYYSVLILSIILICLIGCDDENITKNYELNAYSTDQVSIHQVQSSNTINISNDLSGIIVTGWSSDNEIRIYVYKTIEATTNELAESNFDKFQVSFEEILDTVFINLNYPTDSDQIKFKSCSISIDIPYSMNCTIGYSDGPVFVSSLSSSLNVMQANSYVEVENLNGSCNVSSANQINAVLSIPDSGYCNLNSSNGNISVKFPSSINSVLDLHTEEGIIDIGSLEINNLNQTNNSLQGILGSGNSEMNVYTQKGDISLSYLQ